MSIRAAIEDVIRRDGLPNWLERYPWLLSCLGEARVPIWFVGENPSQSGVEAVDGRSAERTENLQWNSHAGDRLLREAITEAGLKDGPPEAPGGWKCYITNAIKEPEIVVARNTRKRDPGYWRRQADRWLPVLQAQIDSGAPKVLVALGGQSYAILTYMKTNGLKSPSVTKINHYSYVMFRPEAGTGRGPRHPDRMVEFKTSVVAIAKRYGS